MHSGQLRLQDVKRFLRRSQELELSASAIQKLKWFVYALEHDGNTSLTCRHFGIARSTFLCWANRFDAKDSRSLEEHSRRPISVNLPQTDARAIAIIKALRMKQPMMGKYEIQKILKDQYGISLSSSTIGREIARNNFFFGDTPSHRAKRGEVLADNDAPNDAVPGRVIDEPETDSSFSLYPHPRFTS